MDEKLRELTALLEAHPTGRIVLDVRDGRIVRLEFERKRPAVVPQSVKYAP